MKKLIAFFEIPATDFHRAIDFYETVLNMKLPVSYTHLTLPTNSRV